ncbi:hypothetical protein BH11ACT3_BH11ACT3_26050 [soil metagenome]
MKNKKVATLSAAAVLTVVGLAFSALPANAEAPVSPGGYTLAGSDTIQDVVDALVNGSYASGSFVQVKAAGVVNASYDAFPNTGAGSYIQTRTPGSAAATTYFLRPSGSGDGINSMIASNNLLGTTTWTKNSVGYNVADLVDIARSSSGAKTVQSAANATATSLAFIPFARDAVSYAYVEGASWTSAQKATWAALDQVTLKGIYEGTITSVDGITPRPLLPQSASGTRKFFLGSSAGQGIGIGNNNRPAGVASTDEGYQENTAAGVLTAVGEIAPFSAAGWISQSNGVTPINSIASANATLGAAGSVKLGNPLSSSAVFDTTTNPGKLTPLIGFYSDGRWGRNTYLVVPKGKYDADTKLHALLDPAATGSTSLTGFSTSPSASTPGAVKRAFGFLQPTNGTTVIFAAPEGY